MEDFNIDPNDVISDDPFFNRSTDISVLEEGYKTLKFRKEEYCKIKGKDCPITIPHVCVFMCDNFIRQKIPELIKKKVKD